MQLHALVIDDAKIGKCVVMAKSMATLPQKSTFLPLFWLKHYSAWWRSLHAVLDAASAALKCRYASMQI